LLSPVVVLADSLLLVVVVAADFHTKQIVRLLLAFRTLLLLVPAVQAQQPETA
jgi:hypothetical protein